MTRRGSPSRRRRGGVYVLVLAAAMLVTVLGLSAILAARVSTRTSQSTGDLTEARFNAQAAIELARFWIKSDPNWRSRPQGAWASDRPIGEGGGHFSVEVIDPVDGTLSDSDAEAVYVIGTGRKGRARHRTQVALNAEPLALTCLQTVLHAGNDLTLANLLLSSSQTVSANNSVTAADSTLNSDIEAVNAITLANCTGIGKRTRDVPRRSMPGAQVFQHYVDTGTRISMSALSSSGGSGRYIRDVLISPTRNPFGSTTDPNGVYVIDCAGQPLEIERCRIVGTLVLLNANSPVIRGSVNWSPAIANYPALLVEGQAQIELTDSNLAEAATSINFNPSDTPYEGSSDSDTDDFYPSAIVGLVYVSGNLQTANFPTFQGNVVVGGTLSASGGLRLVYRDTWLKNPPPGFVASYRMVVAPRSWKQLTE